MSKIADAVQKASEKFLNDYQLKQTDIKGSRTLKQTFEAMEKRFNNGSRGNKTKKVESQGR